MFLYSLISYTNLMFFCLGFLTSSFIILIYFKIRQRKYLNASLSLDEVIKKWSLELNVCDPKCLKCRKDVKVLIDELNKCTNMKDKLVSFFLKNNYTQDEQNYT